MDTVTCWIIETDEAQALVQCTCFRAQALANAVSIDSAALEQSTATYICLSIGTVWAEAYKKE